MYVVTYVDVTVENGCNLRKKTNSVASVLRHFSLETTKRVIGKMADHADPDQIPQNVASDQGLHCLQIV